MARNVRHGVEYCGYLFTARKRSLRRLCFNRCLSVHGGACVVGGVCAGGHAWQGILPDTVNVRAVRIILECILAFYCPWILLAFVACLFRSSCFRYFRLCSFPCSMNKYIGAVYIASFRLHVMSTKSFFSAVSLVFFDRNFDRLGVQPILPSSLTQC